MTGEYLEENCPIKIGISSVKGVGGVGFGGGGDGGGGDGGGGEKYEGARDE